MSTIPDHLMTYRNWYNEQSSFITPKCTCGGVLLWTIDKCPDCASTDEIQHEIDILKWHIKSDTQYKEALL